MKQYISGTANKRYIYNGKTDEGFRWAGLIKEISSFKELMATMIQDAEKIRSKWSVLLMEYQYPISHDWSTKEIMDVIHFFQSVEKAYEKGIERNDLMEAYRRFKEIVPGKSDEKNICKDFEEVSGYSAYRAVQKMKQAAADDRIKL